MSAIDAIAEAILADRSSPPELLLAAFWYQRGQPDRLLSLIAEALIQREENSRRCICPRFEDIAPNRIADLTCPIHGVDGTNPGDKLSEPPSLDEAIQRLRSALDYIEHGREFDSKFECLDGWAFSQVIRLELDAAAVVAAYDRSRDI